MAHVDEKVFKYICAFNNCKKGNFATSPMFKKYF